MVKPDSSIDYYAALDLNANATNTEIKKQYRKLALLYHPDRNPDEADCVAKFQNISAAHEVLTDKSLRDAYDIDRKRARAGPLYSGRSGSTAGRGNPYTATSAYPPPLRRTQAPPWTKPTSAPPQTGADRFTSFPRPAPTSRKGSETANANVFSAWQKMNASRQRDSQQASKAQAQAQAAQQRAQASFRPVPPRPTVDPNYSAASTEDPSRPGSAAHSTPSPFARHSGASSPSWQRQQGSSRPSSAGLSAGSGWASHRASVDLTDDQNTGAFGSRSARASRTPSFAPPPPPPRPQPTTDVPYAEANRMRTPYINVSGEKTSLSGETLRRTQSTREGVRKNGTTDSPPTQSHKHRSVSPTKRDPQGTSRDKSHVIYISSESSAAGSESESDDHATQPANDNEDFAAAQEARPIDAKHDSGQEDPMQSSIFSIPLETDTFESTGDQTGPKQTNIDTSFSAADWSGTFTGTGTGNAFAAPKWYAPAANRRTPDSVNKRPARLRVSSQKTHGLRSSTPPTSAAGEPQMSHIHPVKSAPLMSNFTPDVWKSSAWDFTPSTTRPSSRDESDKRAHRIPEPASAYGSEINTNKRNSVGEVAPDDAMDVDPTPPLSTAASSLDVNRDSRTYTVPLSAGPGSPKGDQRRSSRASNRAPTVSSADTFTGSSSVNLQSLEQGLDDSQANGLDGLKNMTSGLPFTSKASLQHPTKTFSPESKPLPLIPKGPEVPAKLSLSTWHNYCTAMSHYLKAFTRFNGTMLAHFESSQEHESQLAQLGVPTLEAVGQAGDVGLPSYAALLKDDERFRECWNIAHEKHAETVHAFANSKEKVRKLREGPGLSNS